MSHGCPVERAQSQRPEVKLAGMKTFLLAPAAPAPPPPPAAVQLLDYITFPQHIRFFLVVDWNFVLVNTGCQHQYIHQATCRCV